MKAAWIFAIGIVVISSSALLTARSAEATGFTLTDACGTGNGGPGLANMRLHLRRFPNQRAGQELVLDMPSLLGPVGITGWMDVPGHLCTTSSPQTCTDVRSARVQVLHYSAPYYPFAFIRNWFTKSRISGNFEVNLKVGNPIRGSFKATAHKMKYPKQPTFA